MAKIKGTTEGTKYKVTVDKTPIGLAFGRETNANIYHFESKNLPSPFFSGFKRIIVKILLRTRILQIGLKSYRNPVTAIRGLKKLIKIRRVINGKNKLTRVVRSNGRYFFALNVPGWPSRAFDLFIENELNRVYSFRTDTGHLQTMIFAITKKCPLKCEHCFEWGALNNHEVLSVDDLHHITQRFQERGISQIQFSGGEPLSRLDDLISVMENARGGTDFWVLTSGYGLTIEKAHRLKEAGLAGVDISLDHWNPRDHDDFRGLPGSFQWVVKAAMNVRKADLVLGLTLCAIKSFVSEENLWRYAEIARQLGVSFVQILEPRSVGHNAGKDVDLSRNQMQIMENFFLEINRNKDFRNFPIFMYPAYHQRHIGCFGAGNRYLYVDTDGDIHACPFCQTKSGSCLNESLNDIVLRLQKYGCQAYETTRDVIST